MRRFIFNMFKFTLVSLFMIIAILGLSRQKIQGSKYLLTDSTSQVILGHSHAETAYNDSLIFRTKNLAQSGESYFFTFQKAKAILSDNSQLESVFIEFSNNQIDPIMDEWIWGDKYLVSKFKKYWAYLSLKDVGLISTHNPIGFLQMIPIILNNCPDFLKLDKNSRLDKTMDWGGYNRRSNSDADSLVRVDPQLGIEVASISEYNLLYLQKTIDLALSLKKKVYLLRTPTHKNYQYLSNEKTFMKALSRFERITFLDFQDYPFQNVDFADLGHLNEKGALKFSNSFNELLERGLLNVEDPQGLINEHLTKLKVTREN